MAYDWEQYNIGEFDEKELEKQEMAFSGGLYIGFFRFFPAYAIFRSGMAPLMFPLNAEGKETAKGAKVDYNTATGESRKVLSVRVLESDAEQVINRETEWAPSRVIPGFAEAWRVCLKPSLQEHGLPTDKTWARWACVAMVQDPGDKRTEEEMKKPDGSTDRRRSTFKIARVYKDEETAINDSLIFKNEGPEAMGLDLDTASDETADGVPASKKPAAPEGEWTQYPDDWEKEIKDALAERAKTFADDIKSKPSPIRKATLVQSYTDISIALGSDVDDVKRWDEHFNLLHVLIA